MRLLSVVVSVYNEEGNLAQFRDVAGKVLTGYCDGIDGPDKLRAWDYELIFVNDGSSDASHAILDSFAAQNPRYKVIHFSKNFGHEAAMIAGIDHAKGDFIVCMDADLQNPPELLPKMLEQYENGKDVVLMARADNKDTGLLRKFVSSAFYAVLNVLSGVKFERNVSDFFGISKRVAEVLRKDYREKNRYLRGFIQDVGFKRTVLEYTAPERFAGESKYSLTSLIRIAVHTLNCFSATPMRAGVLAAAVSGVMTLVSFIYYIVYYVKNGYGSGTALLCSMITFLFSILFVLVGVIGEYLGMLMKETKGRPVYIVEEVRNFQNETKGQ